MEAILFMYLKKGNIRVLDIEQAKKMHEDLINDGWRHTATINSCVLIEYIYNNPDYDIRFELSK